ncbi:hypothetical protein BV25DRAFT_1836704 [Artomyces pyxidatus]|uniref:Uncharacterized protein n=1 Tax=Artomyces pyxidatus TaxID=48021 RepID=A0ACB8TA00_9AGAM|nr:hypothetical protein BV25DRAFT_1836704 [Artomyces pyxidatus]
MTATTPTPNTPATVAPLTPPDSSSRPAPAQLDPEPPRGTAAVAQDDTLRTPNVYINGLPPNFPEEQLYAMTKEFGGVISVRTFTRHVSDRPSGYGFVLFETVESAEKCIDALRLYRNLHPSFSKQIHKIPGTSYASLASSGTLSPSPSISSASDGGETFKARMERLKDEASTNLYIEGLPLSIDEPTLGALVAPHAIKSSRFFQTRLSDPPRIIAFVRLETRSACEEVIERLHGRMVRGWNDPGSRISVRFADSAEQRELRRTERTGRGDEPSPSRITMAQAALLNLRGQQVHSQLHGQPRSSSSLPDMQRRLPQSQSRSALAGNQYSASRGAQNAYTRLPIHPITAEYQEPNRLGFVNGQFATSRSAPSHLQARGLPTLQDEVAVSGSDIDISLLPRSANVNGFTPLEQQLILQAHFRAEVEARQEALFEAQGGRSVPRLSAPNSALRSNASANVSRPLSRLSLSSASSKEFVPRGLAPRTQTTYDGSKATLSPIDFLPPMSEDEFHSGGAQFSKQQQQYQQQHITNTPASSIIGFGISAHDTNNNVTTENGTSYDDESKERGVRPSNSMEFVFASNRQQASQGHDQPNMGLHMRSTTLPPQYMHGGSNTSAGASASLARLNGILSPTLHSSARSPGQGLGGKLNISVPPNGSHPSDALATAASHGHPADSPMLVPSPALTYISSSSSSSRTPSTLSPSTPFFGSFANAGDGFGGVNVYKGEEHGHVREEQLAVYDVAGKEGARTE